MPSLLLSIAAGALLPGTLASECGFDDGNGQRQVWVPGCSGTGCRANSLDDECAWCVYDLVRCARAYGAVCNETVAARDAQRVSCVAGPQVDPDFAENITVFHLNSRSAGAVPTNMDTGDVLGDLNFYLGQFLLPLECRDPAHVTGFDCNNPERVDPDLVVTKVVMEVDSRFTNYSACNLCENGTDPLFPFLTNRSDCEIGTYVCDCADWTGQGLVCDSLSVGIQNHQSQTRGFWNSCRSTDPAYKCWEGNSQAKAGGLWYSHPAEGQCRSYSTRGSCTWRVLSTSTVTEDCLKDNLMSAVEDAGPDCFAACGQRNATSDCWIGCFFDTLLGTEARHSNNFSGMPIEDVAEGWTKSFRDEAQGGCPKLLDLNTHTALV